MDAEVQWSFDDEEATERPDIFAGWPNGTLLDIAVAEARRAAAVVEVPESWRSFTRNRVAVELNSWGRSREGNPIYAYPDTRRFVHDFGLDIAFVSAAPFACHLRTGVGNAPPKR